MCFVRVRDNLRGCLFLLWSLVVCSRYWVAMVLVGNWREHPFPVYRITCVVCSLVSDCVNGFCAIEDMGTGCADWVTFFGLWW